MKLLLNAIILVSAFAGLLQADTFIQRKHHTNAYTMNGIRTPAVKSTSIVWLGVDRARIDHSTDSSSIIRLDKNMIYLLRHKVKTYVSEQIDPSQEMLYTAIEDDGDMTRLEITLPVAEMNVSFSGTQKKIRLWNCQKYNLFYSINGDTARSTLWVTNDAKIDYLFYNMITQMYIKKITGVNKEIEKIKGLPIRMITREKIQGAAVNTSVEILEIREDIPASDIYTVPHEYIRTGK